MSICKANDRAGHAYLRADRSRHRRFVSRHFGGVEPLEERWLLTATVSDDLLQIMTSVDTAVAEATFTVDEGNHMLVDLPGISGVLANISYSAEIQTELYLESLDQSLLQSIANAGVRVTGVDTFASRVEAWSTTSEVSLLEEMTGVRAIGLPVFGITAQQGTVESQAGDVLRTQFAKNQLINLSGAGIKVGVISDGITHWTLSRDTGNLPTTISHPDHSAFPTMSGLAAGSGDEGTAMLEIVHDIAPGATLYFASGKSGAIGMASAIQWLVNQGVDVIVDDLWFGNEPWFELGTVAQAAQAAVQSGVSYLTAAGNFAQGHYVSDFVAGATVDGGVLHRFATSSDILKVTIPHHQSTTEFTGVYFQWAAPWSSPPPSQQADYQLQVLVGEQWVNVAKTPGVPYQAFSINNPGSQGYIELRVKKLSTVASKFEFIVFNGFVQDVNNPGFALTGHAAAPGVLAIGAVSADLPNAIANYSSNGPAWFATYSASGTTYSTVNNLAGVGLAHVDTYIGSTPHFDQPFNGTSAAAPSIAGIAALLIQQRRALSLSPSPSTVGAVLKETAVDLGAPGYDQVFGAGRFDALNSLLAPVLVGANPALTFSATPTFKGTAPAGATVQLRRVSDNVAISGSVVVGSNGIYTINSNSLANGSYTVYAAVTSPGIPPGTLNRLTFTVDAFAGSFTPPPAKVNTPVPSVALTFTHAVSSLSPSLFALTNGSTEIPLTGVTMSSAGDLRTWFVNNLSTLTTSFGTWTIKTKNGVTIADEFGNLVSNLSTSWQMIPWQNIAKPADVNKINDVTPQDLQIVVTKLQSSGQFNLVTPTNFAPAPVAPAPYGNYLDASGDNRFSVSDLQRVVTALQSMPQAQPATSWSPDYDVRIRLVAVDMQGNPITSVQVGQQFRIEQWISDVSESGGGVFSVFNLIQFNAALASMDASPLEYASDFTVYNLFKDQRVNGAFLAGSVNSNIEAVGYAPQRLYSATFTATATGQLTFSTGPALNGWETLTYVGEQEIPFSRIDYGQLALSVVPSTTLNYAAASGAEIEIQLAAGLYKILDVSNPATPQLLASSVAATTSAINVSAPANAIVVVAASVLASNVQVGVLGGTLIIDDATNATAGVDYQFTALGLWGSLTVGAGSSTATVTFGANTKLDAALDEVALYTGSAADNEVFVLGTAGDGTTTTINLHTASSAAGQVVQVGNEEHSIFEVHGALVVHGADGHLLGIRDEANANYATYFVTGSSTTAEFGGQTVSISYDGFGLASEFGFFASTGVVNIGTAETRATLPFGNTTIGGGSLGGTFNINADGPGNMTVMLDGGEGESTTINLQGSVTGTTTLDGAEGSDYFNIGDPSGSLENIHSIVIDGGEGDITLAINNPNGAPSDLLIDGVPYVPGQTLPSVFTITLAAYPNFSITVDCTLHAFQVNGS